MAGEHNLAETTMHKLVGTAFLLTLAACTSAPVRQSAPAESAPPAHAKKAIRTEKLEPYSCGTIERLHTYSGIFLASQPAAQDLHDAKAGGVKTIVSFRLADEDVGYDEPALAKELGFEYVNLGFKTPESLTDDVIDRARALFRDEAKRPILAHCHSGNRVGAIWLAHRVLDGGLGWAAALDEAKEVGLKAPAFEQRAAEYVKSHGGRAG